ncbi:Cysteine-rich receptor-like protein kinase 21 [Dendrobium catenatum]|nr:Cysteine-rich receptor-like protein kinase 21 [Dendrobium catenatum]
MDFVDPALDNKFRHDEVARCIYVALLCVQESPDDRPNMTDTVTMLSNVSLHFNPVKQPAFFTKKNASESEWPLNLIVNASNDLSVSTITGR